MEVVLRTLMLVILLLSTVTGSVVKNLYFLKSPQDISVRRGEEAVLRCEAGPRESVSSCMWSRDGSGLGTLDHLPRHRMRGCDLVIAPVQVEDSGEYRCQVGGHSLSPLLSRPGRLSVSVEPGLPIILEAREGDWVEVDQGEELLLTCESQGGKPHAELHWKDSKGEDILGNAVEHITRIGDSNTFKTVSTLRFNPLEQTQVTCTAHSEAFPQPRSSRALTVQLRRKVEEEVVMVRGGEDIQLSCSITPGTYTWILNDRTVQGETANTLDIEDFTPDFHNSLVKCLDQKYGGESRLLKIFRLKMDRSITSSHKPRRGRNTDREVQHDQPTAPAHNEKKIFTCVTEEENDGEPEYVWVKGRLEKRISSAKDRDGRGYKCNLVPGGFKKIKQMEKKFKTMARDIRRFSRTLRILTSPVENR